MADKGAFETYLGVKVYEKENSVTLRFDKESFKELIRNSFNLNITHKNYCMLLMSPCSECGSDKLMMNKIANLVGKQFKGSSFVHLFCFINSTLNSGLTKTDLKLNYAIAYQLMVSDKTVIYTSQSKNKYNDLPCNATLTLINEDIKTATLLCKIKNNQIYLPNEDI